VIVQRPALLERMALRLDHAVTYRHLELAVAALEAEITDTLKAGDEVSLLGFGKFVTKTWGASTTPKHTPGTPGPAATRMKVRAHGVARFVPGARLRAAVRGKR
jgi:nucleoid DNA-binding protein